MELAYTADFGVRHYELGAGGALRPVSLLDYLQEAAAAHAAVLGFGMDAMRERGLTWVMARLHLRAERFPGAGGRVRVRTWPSTRDLLTTCREFECSDGEAKPVARATTAWAVIDLAARRPRRIDDVVPDWPLQTRRAVDDPFPTLPRPGEGAEETRFPVRRADLDVNRHVNNAVYVGWALETVPEEVAGAGALRGVEVAFRAEAFAGDGVVARCSPEPGADEGSFLHLLLRESDGKELARLRTRWG